MMPNGETADCICCLKPLTAEERKHYEYRCEGCERTHFQRILNWRAGAEDKELDALFGDAGERG